MPKVGNRIEDRRLDETDVLRECFAFGAFTAFRVWNRFLVAHERPDNPANRHATEEDIRALCAVASHHGFYVLRGPPKMAFAGFVVLTGGQAGCHPSEAPAATRHAEALICIDLSTARAENGPSLLRNPDRKGL